MVLVVCQQWISHLSVKYQQGIGGVSHPQGLPFQLTRSGRYWLLLTMAAADTRVVSYQIRAISMYWPTSWSSVTQHISWEWVDMLTDVSNDSQPSFWPWHRLSVSDMSVICLWSVSKVTAESWSRLDRDLSEIWPRLNLCSTNITTDTLTKSWPRCQPIYQTPIKHMIPM